ncbi:torsin-1A-interacting protein 2-like isoform X2 [Pristis pectinata]|uniref:torsin-1A-interacting protein 2-like isoform X2 n=1 Tax=Pristis pectinata TaxID=685728 RepID=UPI00223DE9AC|nr:torsin-1A-interacting protein 2-like isoform X2 [Pristis pectinata]
MDGQHGGEGRQLRAEGNESPSEECGYDERPLGNLQEEPTSENTFDHEPISENERCDRKPMKDAQDLKCSKDPKEIQVGPENGEPINRKEISDEKPLDDVQDSKCSKNPKEVEEENKEPTNEKWRRDEIPTGDVQDLNCSKDQKEIEVEEENKETTPEDSCDKKPVGDVESSQCDKKPKQTQAERENTGFSCEKHHQELKGKLQDLPSSYHHDSDEESHVEDGKQSDLGFVWIGVLLVPLFAYFLLNFQSNQEPAVGKVLHTFLQNFEKVQKDFPNQEEQLWKRSRIMLQKQVNKTVHSEPSILMFAAAWDAEETMRCLTSRIAGAYALSFSSRIMEIDGTGKTFLNSDQVKLDLDNQLSSGFGEGRKSAIIHNFQELPPTSTLLFYKYCDHENAAFKDVSLLITVLVDKPRLDPGLSLDAFEETVYNFLTMKFSISSESAQYNVLDVDKFSGLWSRIAHAILPVRPEREIEENGCKQE